MGRSREETDRLIRQSQLYDDLTRRFLKKAGLGNGMRVLDIGSGAGDVALTAAELVGPEGQVVGVDVNAKSWKRPERGSKKPAGQISNWWQAMPEPLTWGATSMPWWADLSSCTCQTPQRI